MERLYSVCVLGANIVCDLRFMGHCSQLAARRLLHLLLQHPRVYRRLKSLVLIRASAICQFYDRGFSYHCRSVNFQEGVLTLSLS